MNTAHKLLMFCVCTTAMLLCCFFVASCGGQPFDESKFGFKENKDVVLLLDVQNKNCVDLVATDYEYSLDFDANILELKDNKLYAKSEGACRVVFTVDWNGEKHTITNMVSVVKPEFCGNVEINPEFVFGIEGKSKELEFSNLNAKYSFDVNYVYNSKHFSVDKSGVLKPISVGSDKLKLKFVSGIDENGNLIYKTLETTIHVVAKPNLQVSVLDENNFIISSSGSYNLISNPKGKTYYFKYYLSENYNFVSAKVQTKTENNTLGDQSLVNLNSEIVNGQQKFVLFDCGETEFCLKVNVESYNHSAELYSNEFKFKLNHETNNIIANAKSTVFDDVIADCNEFNLYQLNETYLTEARANKIYNSVYVEFAPNAHADDNLNIVVNDTLSNVLRKGDGFVVNANNVGTTTFVVSGTNGYCEEFRFVVQKYLPTKADFAFKNKTDFVLTLGETIDLTPEVLPAFAVCNISFVYNSNYFEKNGAVFKALQVGTQTITVNLGQSSKTYNITIQNESIQIFENHNIISSPYSVELYYLVAKANNSTDAQNYNQDVTLKFYDVNGSELVSSPNIICYAGANCFTIYLASGFGCYVEINSPTYAICSNKIWIENNL